MVDGWTNQFNTQCFYITRQKLFALSILSTRSYNKSTIPFTPQNGQTNTTHSTKLSKALQAYIRQATQPAK